MMRLFFVIGVLISQVTFAQTGNAKEVELTMLEFHSAMINKTGNNYMVEHFLDDSLTYGHSNGWIENKHDFLNNLGKRLVYHSFKHDSISVSVNKKLAHVRFVADIDVTMNERRNIYHLRVLEIWVKRGKTWKIFARQAIR